MLTPEGLQYGLDRYGRRAIFGDLAIMRFSHRLRHIQKHGELLPNPAWGALSQVPMIDSALLAEGMSWSLAPDLSGRIGWPDNIHWGADQVANGCRMLRWGLIFGAVAIARQQLERWTLNVGSHHGILPRDRESFKEYCDRAWSTYGLDNMPVRPSLAWESLSEAMHGRGVIVAAIELDQRFADLPTQSVDVPPLYRDLAELVGQTLQMVSWQIAGCASVLAEASGNTLAAGALQRHFSVDSMSDYPDVLLRLLRHLDYSFVSSRDAHAAIYLGRKYREDVGRASAADWYTTGIPPGKAIQFALLERRARALEHANLSFAEEKRLFGPNFNPGILDARLFRFIAISSVAEVVGSWDDQPGPDGLRLAASALYSAWTLWLEDSDVAMMCVRTVLEQTCRARAWRLRPDRAKNLEDTPKRATPTRWIEMAGLKRASILGRALGEFSHFNERSRWEGARSALRELQPLETDGPPEATARRHALESTAYLLAHECAARLAVFSPSLADGFRDTVTLLTAEEHEDQLEEMLGRGLALRGFDFGAPNFVRVSSNEPTEEQNGHAAEDGA